MTVDPLGLTLLLAAFGAAMRGRVPQGRESRLTPPLGRDATAG
jgi:hypothetical protein